MPMYLSSVVSCYVLVNGCIITTCNPQIMPVFFRMSKTKRMVSFYGHNQISEVDDSLQVLFLLIIILKLIFPLKWKSNINSYFGTGVVISVELREVLVALKFPWQCLTAKLLCLALLCSVEEKERWTSYIRENKSSFSYI